MKVLEPCLVVFTGMAAAGKSTIGKEIARQILNAVYFDRDPGMWAMLCVPTEDAPTLPTFAVYVQEDGLLPDNVKEVQTFMGSILKPTKRTGLYKRHVSKQSYLVMAAYAAEFLKLGKVVIVEPFLQRMIEDGTLKRFLELPDFSDFPKRVIHFVADMNTLFERNRARMAEYGEDERSARSMFSLDNREVFAKEMEATHSGKPKGLDEIPHLVCDTTERPIGKCILKCIQYIKHGQDEVI